MAPQPTDVYLICPRKAQQKKHIAVCQRCRHNRRCAPFQEFRQAEIPFDTSPKEKRTYIELPRLVVIRFADDLKWIKDMLAQKTSQPHLVEKDTDAVVAMSMTFLNRFRRDLETIQSLLEKI